MTYPFIPVVIVNPSKLVTLLSFINYYCTIPRFVMLLQVLLY